MLEPQDRDYLEDIVEAARRAETAVAGKHYVEYLLGNDAHDAILLALEDIGKAAGQLSREFRDRHGELSWRSLVGLRNRPMDSTFGINLDTLWRIAVEELPSLRETVSAILADLP